MPIERQIERQRDSEGQMHAGCDSDAVFVLFRIDDWSERAAEILEKREKEAET